MTLRSLWRQIVGEPTPKPAKAPRPPSPEVLEAMRLVREFGEANRAHMQWLSQRNAELTQALLSAKAPPVAPPPAANASEFWFPAEVVAALTDRMGQRWMQTNAGRSAAMWAQMALGDARMSAEDVARKIYEGEDAWS